LENVAWRFLSLSRPKGRFSWRFEFFLIFAEFSMKMINFPQKISLRGIVFKNF